MKQIKLHKVRYDELEVLHDELNKYAETSRLGFNFWSNEEFLNAIIAVDIAYALWLKLRKKIESEQGTFLLTFSLSEAVIILKCCVWKRSGRPEYETHVAEKYKRLIDEQLANLYPVTQK